MDKNGVSYSDDYLDKVNDIIDALTDKTISEAQSIHSYAWYYLGEDDAKFIISQALYDLKRYILYGDEGV